MALPPKELIDKKKREIKIDNYSIEPIKKNYAIWGIAYLFIVECLSFLLWDNPNYKDYWYYILNQLGYVVLLINILCWYDRLRFCNYKIFGLLSLIIYYILGIIAVVFEIRAFINYIQMFFLICSSFLFLIKFFNKK